MSYNSYVFTSDYTSLKLAAKNLGTIKTIVLDYYKLLSSPAHWVFKTTLMT